MLPNKPTRTLLESREYFTGPQARRFFSRVSHLSDLNIPTDEDPEEFFKRLNDELDREDHRFLEDIKNP